jgi:ABC-type branched-subunit amino acid transport system substrate-binding protein
MALSCSCLLFLFAGTAKAEVPEEPLVTEPLVTEPRAPAAEPSPEPTATAVEALFFAHRYADSLAMAARLRPELTPLESLESIIGPRLGLDALSALPLEGLDAAFTAWLAGRALTFVESCAARRCLRALETIKRFLPLLSDADRSRFDSAMAPTSARLAAFAEPSPARIGVLLPLSGPHAAFGLAARKAIELAAPVGISLEFRDTAGDANTARTQAEALVFDSRATALLGPIGRIESAAVSAFARAWAIPHLPLTTSVDLPDELLLDGRPDPVLRLRTAPAELAEALARHVRIELRLSRAAIFLPEQVAAREQAEAFARAFESLGGTIVRTVAFDPNASVDSALKELLIPVTSKKPKIDFDALFFPADVPTVKRLLPVLHKKGLALRLTPDSPAQKGTPRVQLLGISAWSTALLIDHTDRLTDNAIFTDTFVPDADTPAVSDFVARFTAAHRDRPTPLQAEAFDATRLLALALLPASPVPTTHRDLVLERLFAPRQLAGVTGQITIDARRVRPRVHLRTVDGTRLRARLPEADERALRSGAPLLETPAAEPMGPVLR